MIIVIDLETTGLDAKLDKIIEVGLVKFNEKTFDIIEKKSFLINPEFEIPLIISNICNISNNDVLDAPKFEDIKNNLEYFIGDLPILGHNIGFDISFLKNNGLKLEKNLLIDTFKLSNFLFYKEKSLSLEYLSSSLGLELNGAHRALNDCIATFKLFKIIVDKIKKLSTKQKIFFEFIANFSQDNSLDFVYNIVYNKKIKKIDFDIFLKEFLKGLYSNKNNSKIQINSEKKLSNIEDFIKNSSQLELRENQFLMSEYIKDSFENEEKVVIEAPTGVGKTFAYLLPSIIHSVKTGEQVYISTSTKALQDQIFYKDLEFLSKKLDIDFSYCKLKGKNNYLSISSFINFFNNREKLTKIEASFCLKILFWLINTKYAELDELDFYGEEYGFLSEVNANDYFTFSKDNIYSKYEFAIKARKNAKNSNLIIINNNILFQDIDGDNNILGKLDNLILDEGHSLEDVVTNSLKKGFSLFDFEKNLLSLEKILRKHKFEIGGLKKKTDLLLFEIGIIFESFQLYLNKKLKNADIYQSILIEDDFYDDKLDIVDKNELSRNFLLKITEYIDGFSIVPDEVYIAIGRELRFLEESMQTIKILLDKQDNNKYIKIITYNNKIGGIILEYSLLNIGNYLNNKLWSKLNTCILTSATLKIGDNFDYIKNILSLGDFSFKTLKSDFDYSKQSLLYIADDLGSVKNNLDYVIDFLSKFFLVVKGNTLVLFTAFYAIKQTYESIANLMNQNKINIYAQGLGGGKHKLIETFKQNANNSILIGTDTFWEGIDISGDDLKYLVIHKVPFMVPSDPIFKARSKIFKNSFQDYSIPKAILKLKQGFGRLIRTKTDTGIVVFLDDRIFSSYWGNVLYKAFPDDIKIRKGKSSDLINILKKKN